MAEKNRVKYSITEGAILPSFIVYTLPLIAAGCLQQSYTIADGLILGNAIDQEALGSVGSVGAIIDICTLIQISLGNGCAIIISHLYGAKKYSEVRHLIIDMRRLITVISIVIAIIAILTAEHVLMFLHTPESLMKGAAAYMRITFTGVPFMALYSLHAGVLRGMGDSTRPLCGIAVSSAVNICLDIICVMVIGLGIEGAAIATVAAEGLSAFYLFLKLEDRCRSFSGISDTYQDRKKLVFDSIRIGSPQIVQSLVSSGGRVMLQNITNILGDAVVIGVTVAFKVDSLLLIPLMSIGTAVAVFTGQNSGAGKKDRVKETFRYGAAAAVIISLALSLILWRSGYSLFTLFGLTDTAAGTGYRYIVLCLPFYWIFGIMFILNGYLNGEKQTAVTSASSVAGLAVRVSFVYVLYRRMGADVLPVAEAMSWVTAVLIDICFILVLRKREGTEAG